MPVNIPPIPATTPLVVPAVAERTFGDYTLQQFQVEGDGTDGLPVRASARFVLRRQLEDGSWETHPDAPQPVLRIEDLWAEAEADALAGDFDLYNAMTAVMRVAGKKAKAKNLI